MMRMKDRSTGLSPMNGGSPGSSNGGREAESGSVWEIRPGGMLVQKRNPDSDRSSLPPPTIRVRVKYGSILHQISISSQATFGELKKMLTGPTGLHHLDQKLMYKDKERDSKTFLDFAGVKDRSKIVLLEDPISKEKRFLEMQKNAKMEKASRLISEISLEVDRLAGQVSTLESIITKSGNVAEKEVLNLIELLMNQLLLLDGIIADGDAKIQRKIQVKRVQKYVESLDVLKMKTSKPSNTDEGHKPMNKQQKYSVRQNHSRLAPILEQPLTQLNGQRSTPAAQEHRQPRHSVGDMPIQPSKNAASGPVVVTTRWETFDSSTTPAIVPANSDSNNNVQPKFNWELFD